ncbi:hypothetical protein [Leifsonia sp. NCR5]|uniref:hypothetical protein n=1 Tax=Leifsonia sp. NCR5 TaxID=1978342 RepID=UPI0011799A45|nr:hypothetical protein [Leifsonia sp. NCR5]
MSATEFTQERSDAIRRLLIDTVDAEPRRRRRFQILVTSVLASAAVVLAGGTAALALTGVIRFDAPPPPPPVPTSSRVDCQPLTWPVARYSSGTRPEAAKFGTWRDALVACNGVDHRGCARSRGSTRWVDALDGFRYGTPSPSSAGRTRT